MFSNLCCGHGAVQELSGDIRKVRHLFIERHQDAHLLELRQPGDIAAGYVGQCIGVGTDQDLVVKFRPLVGDSIDFDAGVFRLKGRNQDIHQGFILCRLRAVMMPEADGHTLLLGHGRAECEQHHAGCRKGQDS